MKALSRRVLRTKPYTASLALLVLGFMALLFYYGLTVLPFWPDESLFLEPARNLAEGKGMRTPALDDLLPGIAQRTYWQPPVYFLMLAGWGKGFGFTIASARWLSRLCGVVLLLLLWCLARRWGVSNGLALLCVLWTALDLAFQYNANLGRMDTLNALWLIACLLGFTTYLRDGKQWQASLAGLFGALATLTHFIAIPPVIALGVVLWVRRDWLGSLWFIAPLTLGWLAWLVYAGQDWTSFLGQMKLQFARKGETGWQGMLLKFPFLTSIVPLYGVFPTNAPPLWFALVLISLVAWWRKRTPLRGWMTLCLSALYAAAAFGGELWYAGWFTPFGYLLLTIWLQATVKTETGSRKRLIWGFCCLLLGYQLVQIGRTVAYVKPMQHATMQFFSDLPSLLPRGAGVVLHSVPDPFPILSAQRPDLRLVQLSPTPMPRVPLEQLLDRVDFFVGIKDWGQGRGLVLKAPPLKVWEFLAPVGEWTVGLYPLYPNVQKSRSVSAGGSERSLNRTFESLPVQVGLGR